jgi:hypothetical protein
MELVGLAGDYPKVMMNISKYTPAWQEAFTGISSATHAICVVDNNCRNNKGNV